MSGKRLSVEQLERNFADLHPLFTRNEAVAEAARCLYCWDAPCTRSCPAQIDVPGFIRRILHDDPAGAAELIFRENILGGSCARACPTEVLCEGACVDMLLKGRPVMIGRLQRYATDFATDAQMQFFGPGHPSGYRVAIVGSGPAGLSCAHELRILGHDVEIFEARDIPGGLNTLGLSYYKVTTDFALKEVEFVRRMGVEIHLDSPVDSTQLGQMLDEYDSVFLGVGLGSTQSLDLPGEDGKGVLEALQFIFQSHIGALSECEVGREVVVIGGGNTAVDVATQAVRLGAEKVTMVYRRTDEIMSAFRYEYDLARADGVHFEWLTSPVEFVLEEGKLKALRCVRMELEDERRDAGLEAVEDSEFEIPCDMAVKALGQSPLSKLLGGIDGLKFEKGRVVVDPETGATSLEGLYAGGDCISNGAELVHAIQEGKIAARSIHEQLMGAS